ncbi:MAG: hypothetical protein V4596_00640 [Bdellovibrionota bacterium]
MASTNAFGMQNSCKNLFKNTFNSKELIKQSNKDMIASGHKPELVDLDSLRSAIWRVDGAFRKRHAYELSFKYLLNKIGIKEIDSYFENYLMSLRENGRSTHVLDLFGSGVFLRDPTLADSSTGMRFEPLDWANAGVEMKNRPREVIGDITHLQTWKMLDRFMENKDIPKMDLVVMRPDGGWWQAPWFKKDSQYFSVLRFIIFNTLARMSPDGQFYFDIKWRGVDVRKSTHRKAIESLKKEIWDNTPYELIIVDIVEPTAIKTLERFNGLIKPKEQKLK